MTEDTPLTQDCKEPDCRADGEECFCEIPPAFGAELAASIAEVYWALCGLHEICAHRAAEIKSPSVARHLQMANEMKRKARHYESLGAGPTPH